MDVCWSPWRCSSALRGGWYVKVQRPLVPRNRRTIEAASVFITEIFKSIQGEGTRAGLPCIFARLTGCNLRCTWCDTAYAFHGGKRMKVDEICHKVDELAGRGAGLSGAQARVPLVELTGGEPLLQEEIYPLAEKL